MDISHSNMNRNCKPIIKNDSGTELTQSPVANDGTVNFLHQQRLKYAKNLIIGHLNINSIRNKFLDFKELVLSDTDICLISDTKLGDSFPDQQFHVNGYKMFRKNWNRFGGGLILFVKENILCKVLNTFLFSGECEIISIDFSISNKNGFFWSYIIHHHKMKLYLLNRLNLLSTLIVQHAKIFSFQVTLI